MDSSSPELSIQLRQLAYLAEVARAETWTDAADRLGISQPALSQSMHELERRLDIRLFEPVGRRRVLTPEGRQAVGFAREVLTAAGDLQATFRASGDQLLGSLEVGMIDAASLYVLPPAIRAFRAAHPLVDLSLTVAPSTPLLDGLRTLQYDLVYVTGPVDEPDVQSETVLAEPLYLYGPEEGDPATGDWILYPGASRTRGVIDRFFGDAGWAPRIILESANPAVLTQMVVLGFGWAILPEAVAEAGRTPLQKRRSDPVARRLLAAAWRASSAGNPRLEAFRAAAAGDPTS